MYYHHTCIAWRVLTNRLCGARSGLPQLLYVVHNIDNNRLIPFPEGCFSIIFTTTVDREIFTVKNFSPVA